MGLVLTVALLAVGVGWLLGGDLGRLGRLRLRGKALVAAAAAVQLAGAVLGGSAYGVGLAGSALLVVAFLARNTGLRGVGLVVLGLLLNAAVVCANGAMPVSLPAAERAGAPIGDVLLGLDPRHELAGRHTRLPALGDVVPVPLPLRPEVASAGDVLVAAGLGELLALAMGGGLGIGGGLGLYGGRRAARRRPAAPEPDRSVMMQR